MKILIVRLGALGDVVHTVPVAAALRRAHPMCQIDWIVDARHAELLDLVRVLDRVIALESPAVPGWVRAVRELRQVRYDVALDLQGLMKSALLARASGAKRVIGFSVWHLREKGARPFYSEVGDPPAAAGDHVIVKNLRLLRTLGIETSRIEFPLRDAASPAADVVRGLLGDAPFAVLNPGAAWPNKRWPAERLGGVASFLRDVRGLRSVVVWGPGEAPLAQAVVDASDGAAIVAPPTRMGDLVRLSRAATVVISGDTGPLHVAAAAGTPLVAIFGPTDPLRNGPIGHEDVSVSRYEACGCHYQRRCHQARWCLEDVNVAEVTAAIQQRLSRVEAS